MTSDRSSEVEPRAQRLETVGRRLLRIGGVIGVGLSAFVFGSVLYNEWDKAQGGGSPDWLIIAGPAVLAVAAGAVAARLPAQRRWSLLVLGFGAAMTIGGLMGAGMVAVREVTGGAGLAPVLLAVGVLVAGPAMATMLPWWRRTDEAARQAHLSGFFWGGSAGAFAAIPLLMMPYLQPGSIPAISAMTPDDAFFAGAMTLYLAIAAGYLVCWAWWWVRKR